MTKPRRLWSLALLLAGALALAACLPPGPDQQPLASQDCIAGNPTSAAAYQQLFDLRSTTWDAGDTTAFVSRGGNPGVWLFGDTYSGRVMHDGSLGAGWKMVNSSAMTESGNCLTPHFGGAFLDPHELFQNPGDGSWYWPGGAVARGDGSMQVMLVRVRSAATGDPNVNFAPVGVSVATVGADMTVQSITSIPASWTAGSSGLRPYGDAVTTDGTYAYLYAFAPVWIALNQFVARVPLNNLTGQWEYSGCAAPGPNCARSWSTDPGFAWPMEIPNPSQSLDPKDNLPLAAMHVIRVGSHYVSIAKGSDIATGDGNLNKVYAWSSATPYGPWTPQGAIVGATLPANNSAGEWTYSAQLVPTLHAGWVVTWNANAPSGQVYAWVRHYGPRFAQPAFVP